MKIRTLAASLVMAAAAAAATLYVTGMNRPVHAEAVAAKAGPIYAQLSSMTTQRPKNGGAAHRPDGEQ